MDDSPRERVDFGSLLAGFETDALDTDVSPVSAFALIKSRTTDGETVWSGRSGGEQLSSEELLGALSGLVESMRRDLADDWEW